MLYGRGEGMDSNIELPATSQMGVLAMRSEHYARYENALARAAYHVDIASTAMLLLGRDEEHLKLQSLRMELRERLERSVDERYGLRTRPSRPSGRASTPRA